MLRIRTTFSFSLRSQGYCRMNCRPLLGSTALLGTAVALVAPQGAPALVVGACASAECAPDVNVKPSIAPANRPVIRFMTFSLAHGPHVTCADAIITQCVWATDLV